MMYSLNGKEIYIEKAVANGLDKKIIELKDDGDIVCAVTSGEGFGKSTFAQTLGGYFASKLGTSFTIDNIHFNTDSFIEFAENAPKYTVVILDESRSDLYRGSSNSNKNKNFTHWLSECRAKNLVLILLIPSIHDFDPYINKWRTSIWFELTKIKDKEGIYKRGFYNVMAIKKRKLFLKYLDKKYSRTPQSLKLLRGHFTKTTPIDKNEYEKKKDINRKEKFEKKKEEKEQINLPPSLISWFANKKPAELWQPDSKEYETGRKWLYSLRKVGKLETG